MLHNRGGIGQGEAVISLYRGGRIINLLILYSLLCDRNVESNKDFSSYNSFIILQLLNEKDTFLAWFCF